MRPSATIHLRAIRANFAIAAQRARGEPIAVVKADAYGHGAVRVTRALLDAGCRRFAVATVEEGVALRDAEIGAPVLVLGGAWTPEEARACAERALTPVVHAHAQLDALKGAAGSGRLPVHVEVDTGMRRMGVAPDEAVALLQAVDAEPSLALDGVYTHFARADEADPEPTLAQLAAFRAVLERARALGIAPRWVHAANSAGLLGGAAVREALPEANAARPGLMLYGANPAAHVDVALSPAMTLCARVVALRAVRRGEAVGYSAQFHAPRDTRVATLAIGYADGVPVATSGAGEVSIRGRRLPIAGRVSMDFVGVDVGDAPVEVGDVAVLFGARGDDAVAVERAAEAAGTIAYELLVRVGARVRRIYENGGGGRDDV